MSNYKTLHKFGVDEYIVEKSTFIGYAKPIKTEEEAIEFVNEIKKKHKDATHNVWAYTVGENMNIQRYSDDGEPQGTAGIPTLEVIKKEDLRDVVVVVTRYFGGIKLGAGGLVRAYTNAVSEAIKEENIISLKKILKKRIVFDYSNVNNINYLLKDYNITYKEFDEIITYEIIIEKDNPLLELLKDNSLKLEIIENIKLTKKM